MTESDWIEIGKIVAPQGLAGELRVYPSTDFPERFLLPGQRWLRSPQSSTPEPVQLISGRYVEGKSLYVIRLDGVQTRDQAEALRNYDLLVPESDRLPLEDDDEFHVSDLLGMDVFDQASQTLVGTVVDVMTAGHDLLAVKPPMPEVVLPPEPIPAPHPDQRKTAKPRAQKRQVAPPPLLIPFVKAIVPVVDLQRRRIEITPPPGLIDDRAITDA